MYEYQLFIIVFNDWIFFLSSKNQWSDTDQNPDLAK